MNDYDEKFHRGNRDMEIAAFPKLDARRLAVPGKSKSKP
jgi:hypothetical protein